MNRLKAQATPGQNRPKSGQNRTTDRAGWTWMAAASASQRPFWAGVPPGDLSSYSSRPTFKPAAVTYRGYVSHSLCQLVDQPRTAGQPVDTFGWLSKVEPERLPTVSVDHRNATCRPAALLVAALPHGHQVAMRPSRPHRHLMAAVSARRVAKVGRQWPAGPTLGPLSKPGPSWTAAAPVEVPRGRVAGLHGKAGPLSGWRKGATSRPF